MGYYYDDWEGVFMQKQLFSSQQIWQYFLIDRPFSSILHTLYNPVFGPSPIGWRIFGQLINWAAILVLVRTLLLVWPKRIMEIGWIGLLLALYPGISRQFVIRTSMPHYTSMLLFALSLWFMVKAEITLQAPDGFHAGVDRVGHPAGLVHRIFCRAGVNPRPLDLLPGTKR